MCHWWKRLLLPPRSVTECLGTTHFILAAKWVNRVWSVQLPPHCRGVLAGMACGESELSGVRQSCNSSTCCLEPSLVRISICLYSCAKNKKKKNKQKKKTPKNKNKTQGTKTWALWGWWQYWITWMQFASAMSEDVCKIRRCCPQQWPHVNVSPSNSLLCAWLLPCSFQGRWIFLPPPTTWCFTA